MLNASVSAANVSAAMQTISAISVPLPHCRGLRPPPSASLAPGVTVAGVSLIARSNPNLQCQISNSNLRSEIRLLHRPVPHVRVAMHARHRVLVGRRARDEVVHHAFVTLHAVGLQDVAVPWLDVDRLVE